MSGLISRACLQFSHRQRSQWWCRQRTHGTATGDETHLGVQHPRPVPINPNPNPSLPRCCAARSGALLARDPSFAEERGPRVSGAPLRATPRPGSEAPSLQHPRLMPIRPTPQPSLGPSVSSSLMYAKQNQTVNTLATNQGKAIPHTTQLGKPTTVVIVSPVKDADNSSS